MVYATGDMHGDYALFSQKKFKNIITDLTVNELTEFQ